MLSRLTNFATGTTQPCSHPSTVLTLEAFPEICALHIVPEDSTAEFINYTKDRVFGYGGAKERSREQLGFVSLRIGSREALHEFLRDVSQRVKQDPSLKEQSSNGEHDAHVVQQALRSAAVSCAYERGNQESTTAATQSYPIFLVPIDRAKPGKIIGEPRSVAHW